MVFKNCLLLGQNFENTMSFSLVYSLIFTCNTQLEIALAQAKNRAY